MMKGKVSVLMAVYNVEGTIREALDSLIGQTYDNWQAIICDDASVDDTYAVAREYEEKFPDKFKVIKNEANSKLPYSLNHCLKYADGEFVARMDGDDISLPERFEKQVDFLNSHPDVTVVGTSMIRFDEKGEFGIIEYKEFPDKYALKNGVPHAHATIMMRKEAMDNIGGYTVSKITERGEDLDLWFRFYAAGYKGANLKEAYYKVREDKNTLKRRKLRYDFDYYKIRKNGYKMLKFPFWWRIYAFKPIISHFVPYRLKVWRRNRKTKK